MAQQVTAMSAKPCWLPEFRSREPSGEASSCLLLLVWLPTLCLCVIASLLYLYVGLGHRTQVTRLRWYVPYPKPSSHQKGSFVNLIWYDGFCCCCFKSRNPCPFLLFLWHSELPCYVCCVTRADLTARVTLSTRCDLHRLSKKRILCMVTGAHVLIGGGISESMLESVP